jgi:oxygen-independent coproporphyrinogen-3 oxidase
MIYNSLYLHIPFCTHRCGYCDFNSYAGLEALIPDYASALCKEIAYISRASGQKLPVHTIYFGGGTPSLIPARELGGIITAIKDNFTLIKPVEITLEANPGTVNLEYLKEIHQMGVTRISLGMQSAAEAELRLLERQHSFIDVAQAVDWARDAGFDNLNLDLIFGLPRQTLQSWMKSLEAALALSPEHLSMYGLTIEPGTPLQRKVESGLYPVPDPDVAADMYEVGRGRLAEAEYIHYEISNWAKSNETGKIFACKHNLQYWRNLPYLGVGAGAHGFISHYRTVNISTPQGYIRKMLDENSPVESGVKFPESPSTVEITPIDIETEIGETMMMGLRLVEDGVSSIEFQRRFGIRLEEKFSAQIERYLSYKLLEWVGDHQKRLRLTIKGQMLGNQVFQAFI